MLPAGESNTIEDKGMTFQQLGDERRISKEDEFVSATDLSSLLFLDSSLLSNSSGGESNSTSSPFHSSCPVSTTDSLSSSQNSSSENNGGTAGTEEVFSTCSFSSTPSTVRRSESWSGLRSASGTGSFDSTCGSDKDIADNYGTICTSNNMNVTGKEKENEYQAESYQTYHTPSTSMHNIPFNRSNSDGNPLSSLEQKTKYFTIIPDSKNHVEEIEVNGSEGIIQMRKFSQTNNDESSLKPLATLTLNEKIEHDDKTVPELEHGTISSGDFLELASASSESNTSKEGINVIVLPPTSKQLKKAAKLTRKPAKKRMWYQQIFSTSYKTRNSDFKKLFKDLPLKERLLVDYSCAVQKEILAQGRMYVSQEYLNFHANIFGWETLISIRLKDITSITKEKTALVIPNAIQVITDSGEKHFFTSFVTRDSTFLMLFKLWQNALLEDGMPSKEMQRLVLSSYGEELVITSDDDIIDMNNGISNVGIDEIFDGSDLQGRSKSILIDSSNSKVYPKDIAPAIVVSGSISSAIGTPQSHPDKELKGPPRSEIEPSDLSESSDSDEDFQTAEGIIVEELDSIEVPICPVSHTDGKETVNAIIPCSIDQLFTMLFTNSKFYLDLHTSRKTFNINQSPWEFGKDGKQTRQVSMTVSPNSVMGPKHVHVTETQVMDPISRPGLFYVIGSESVNSGVPYADAFYVTVHICLSRVSPTETKLIVVNQIKYRKSVWGITKSIIEKNAWQGIEEFYSHLERALKEECAKMLIGASPIPSPKHSSLPRRRLPRKKRMAPDIPVVLTSSSRNGTLRNTISEVASIPEQVTESSLQASFQDGPLVLKIILTILGFLLLLNGFLYLKLSQLENTTTSQFLFPQAPITFSGEVPQSHQDWIELLQKQEVLHRTELQKWHDVLRSALKILHRAESDLESLKFHINSYSGGQYSADLANQIQSSNYELKGEATSTEETKNNQDDQKLSRERI